MFITFEGADGSGKSTQAEVARQYLTDKGYDVVTTRDPGGTELGLELREILLNYPAQIYNLSEMFIFLADRAQHVNYKIKPLLKDGKIVLCDRFIDSTVAYQGYGRGISIEAIEYMNSVATQGLVPDKTFLFDISVETTMNRVASGGKKDRLESEVREFHQRVIDGYRDIARHNPERFVIINSNEPVEDVSNNLKEVLDSIFLTKTSGGCLSQ